MFSAVRMLIAMLARACAWEASRNAVRNALASAPAALLRIALLGALARAALVLSARSANISRRGILFVMNVRALKEQSIALRRASAFLLTIVAATMTAMMTSVARRRRILGLFA